MFFKTIKRNSQKKLENDTYLLIMCTVMIFLFWFLSFVTDYSDGYNCLFVPFAIGAFLSLIKTLYVFKGNIMLFRNRMLIFDVSYGILNVQYKKIKAIKIGDEKNGEVLRTRVYGNSVSDIPPIVLLNITGEEYIIFCQTPNEFYKKVRGKITN